MNIFPLGSRVLVAEEKVEKVSSFGIIIDGNAGDSRVFQVVAKGPDVWRGIEVGQRVFIDSSKGQIVSSDGKQRILLPVDGITAIVTE